MPHSFIFIPRLFIDSVMFCRPGSQYAGQ